MSKDLEEFGQAALDLHNLIQCNGEEALTAETAHEAMEKVRRAYSRWAIEQRRREIAQEQK